MLMCSFPRDLPSQNDEPGTSHRLYGLLILTVMLNNYARQCGRLAIAGEILPTNGFLLHLPALRREEVYYISRESYTDDAKCKL